MEITTEHFIAKPVEPNATDLLYHIFIKNIDNTVELFTIVTKDFVIFPKTKLQDYITSWDLQVELIKLLDSLQ